MQEAIESYIRAVKQNIAEYMLIEDFVERQRSLDAAHGMLEDFEKLLSVLKSNK